LPSQVPEPSDLLVVPILCNLFLPVQATIRHGIIALINLNLNYLCVGTVAPLFRK
jgi:hypothetical protein